MIYFIPPKPPKVYKTVGWLTKFPRKVEVWKVWSPVLQCEGKRCFVIPTLPKELNIECFSETDVCFIEQNRGYKCKRHPASAKCPS